MLTSELTDIRLFQTQAITSLGPCMVWPPLAIYSGNHSWAILSVVVVSDACNHHTTICALCFVRCQTYYLSQNSIQHRSVSVQRGQKGNRADKNHNGEPSKSKGNSTQGYAGRLNGNGRSKYDI